MEKAEDHLRGEVFADASCGALTFEPSVFHGFAAVELIFRALVLARRGGEQVAAAESVPTAA